MNKITVFYDHIRQAMIQENMSLEEIAAKLVAAGIRGIETDYLDTVGSDGHALVHRLAQLGLPISSVYCHFRWDLDTPVQNYNDVLSNLNELGISNILVIPGFLRPGQSPADSRKELIPYVQEMCVAAASYNINVVMEDFDDKVAAFGTSEDLKDYLDNIPELGCAFDTGNFLYFGEDASSALNVLIDRVTYVHCKDRSLTPYPGENYQETVTGQKLYSSPVGSGVIPMTEILTRLLATGYDGPLAIEHFGSQKQLSDMLSSAQYLKQLLSAE